MGSQAVLATPQKPPPPPVGRMEANQLAFKAVLLLDRQQHLPPFLYPAAPPSGGFSFPPMAPVSLLAPRMPPTNVSQAGRPNHTASSAPEASDVEEEGDQVNLLSESEDLDLWNSTPQWKMDSFLESHFNRCLTSAKPGCKLLFPSWIAKVKEHIKGKGKDPHYVQITGSCLGRVRPSHMSVG